MKTVPGILLLLACTLVAAAPDGKAARFQELEKDAKAPRAETRRAAVQGLAELGDRKAWDLVVGLLDDKESMVADEAEVALGSVADPKLVADLLGPAGLGHKDAWVRLRIAEAVGRVPCPLDAERLARAFLAADPNAVEFRRTLLWTVERQAQRQKIAGDPAKLFAAADRIAGSRQDPELRGAALQAMVALDGAAAHATIVEWLAERDRALRCAAMRAVATLGEQECLDRSRAGLDDAETSVRAQAIENLAKLASRASMLALANQLGVEKRERLKYTILAYLRGMSGLDVGFDPDAWRRWAETIRDKLSTGEGPVVRATTIPGTKASFAGLNLISDRVCFLVDFSGSTWQTKIGEKTRKEVLDAKLRQALEALPAGTRFNLMPYTNDPIPWEKKLVASDPSTVKRALEFFERCHRSGRGNFFDAALLALEDPDVDTIVVLTDGVPTGGHRWNLELMFEVLVEKDRYRKVAFDSILVDAPKSKQRLWQELAERTGGRMVVAKLD
jgi:HEAT repeat protein